MLSGESELTAASPDTTVIMQRGNNNYTRTELELANQVNYGKSASGRQHWVDGRFTNGGGGIGGGGHRGVAARAGDADAWA
jgi:outer membrane lipoprotein SlyB